MVFNQSWSVTFKLAFSICLLILIVAKTVVTLHSRDLKVNKISLLVYYAVIAQALFMLIYYVCFKAFDLFD